MLHAAPSIQRKANHASASALEELRQSRRRRREGEGRGIVGVDSVVGKSGQARPVTGKKIDTI